MDIPVVSAAEMRAAEKAAFDRGRTAEQLMDEAGAGIAQIVQRFFPRPGKCIVFAGKGNNAGDAFVAATHLERAGWQLDLRRSFLESDCNELCRKKLAAIRNDSEHARTGGPTIVLDGLLGIGAALPLREPIRSACREINQLRCEQNAFVFAIDVPTGLETDDGSADSAAVVADFTLAIGASKHGLVADRALEFVGRLEVVPLKGLNFASSDSATIGTATTLRHLLPRRNFGGYKNQYGRVGIIAGSKGLTGASILCSLGAVRGGAGLVELFVREDIYETVAASAPPEVMVKPVRSYAEVDQVQVDVWAVGPGLGQSFTDEVLELIRRSPQPMVIDADALTILAGDMDVMKRAAGPRLLTPHPGEMKRLFPCEKLSRAEIARRFVSEYPVTLLLKGSRTIVAEREKSVSYNTTGNPGMATGGMGDTLTGVCAALIAQRLTPYDAACVGAWSCGRAAELAIFSGSESEESLIARDVSNYLGVAFRELHSATH